MNELEHMQKAMDTFFEYLDKDVFNKEEEKREAERNKENAHRKEEGLCTLK